MIHTPPNNWKLMAYWVGRNTMNSSAPALTTSEVNLAICDSSRSLMFGRTYSRQMLRVNRLAAAIDMIEAGTSAPMAIAAKAKPTNQDGNICTNRPGTTHWAPNGARG